MLQESFILGSDCFNAYFIFVHPVCSFCCQDSSRRVGMFRSRISVHNRSGCASRGMPRNSTRDGFSSIRLSTAVECDSIARGFEGRRDSIVGFYTVIFMTRYPI
jgi:hypothetical protein